jgi:hypothetical protein
MPESVLDILAKRGQPTRLRQFCRCDCGYLTVATTYRAAVEALLEHSGWHKSQRESPHA